MIEQVLGPLFLIFALFLAGRAVPIFNYDLAVVAVLGLYLSARWHFRGCIYALILLAISAGIKHVLLPEYHFWQTGLEFSAALSFLITAMTFEEAAAAKNTLENQTSAQTKTIQCLEEDLAKVKEQAATDSSMAAEKMAALQSQLEEAATEVSTFTVLNDVLRKSTAKALEEQEICREKTLTAVMRDRQWSASHETLQKELSRLRDESSLAHQNAELFHDLNEARFHETQTRLINETLVRLRASENLKVKELEKEKKQWQDHLQLRPKIREVEKLNQELLQERTELLTKLQQHPQSSQYEQLYRQLKGHFDEKNDIIHKARVDLFRTDTELQTVKIKLDQKNLEIDPIIGEVSTEVEKLLEEQTHLYEHIDQLQDLVSHLMQSTQVQKKN
jgi:hypothetical protein